MASLCLPTRSLAESSSEMSASHTPTDQLRCDPWSCLLSCWCHYSSPSMEAPGTWLAQCSSMTYVGLWPVGCVFILKHLFGTACVNDCANSTIIVNIITGCSGKYHIWTVKLSTVNAETCINTCVVSTPLLLVILLSATCPYPMLYAAQGYMQHTLT